MTKQTISEFKIEGQEKLARFKQLLNKNEHTREELDELSYIDKKYGKHPMFIQAAKDNYDARAGGGWGGFGLPNCMCHINPPCQNCIDYTNSCEERIYDVSDKKEPGCLITEHDCPVGRGEVRV